MKKIKLVQTLLILLCAVSLGAVPPRFETIPKASKKARWNFEIVNTNKEGAIQVSIVQLAPGSQGASQQFKTLFIKREVRPRATFRTTIQSHQKVGIVVWDRKGI